MHGPDAVSASIVMVRVLRENPLLRVKVKFTVKNAVWEESSATAYGVFYCDFIFDLSRVDLLSELR